MKDYDDFKQKLENNLETYRKGVEEFIRLNTLIENNLHELDKLMEQTKKERYNEVDRKTD